jgi:CRISPR-associated protein Csx10
MSIRLEFEITFKSDFHIGAGHGLGLEIDSALLRDADGVPVIRGTMLAGLLRESLMNLLALDPLRPYRRCRMSEAGETASETTSEYCGQFDHQAEDCPLCTIFGSPRRPKRWRISSARPAGLEEPQKKDKNGWRAGETAAQSATRVRVNPRTRRAENSKLFTREEGDSSLRFRFVAECVEPDAGAQDEAAWLTAAARNLRNLGASKRRGRGECSLHLVAGGDEQALLERFAQILGADRDDAGQERSASPTATTERFSLKAPSNHAYRLQVLVRIDEPLLLARRAEAGNQYETLESIPGAVLRGALAWRIAKRFGAALNDKNRRAEAAYQNFVDLFFHNAVRFSSLLPVQASKKYDSQGHPTLVAPRDLVTCKLHPGYKGDQGHGVWSLAYNDAMLDQCPECGADVESVSGFLLLNPADLSMQFKPQQRVEMHIRVDPKTGRVSTGNLFGYVTLEPGQYFAGEITCTDEQVWKTLAEMADLVSPEQVQHLHLGKASRRGHGKVSLIVRESETPPWQGTPLHKRVTDANKVVLTLVSDAIIADPWGRYAQGFAQEWLQRELDLPAGVKVHVDETRAFSAVRTVDAFNGKLGLPRTRDQALVAGSSVRLSFSGMELSPLQAHLAAVEAHGIGLRREEGFGCLTFNHPVYARLTHWDKDALDLNLLELKQDAQKSQQILLKEFAQAWAEILSDKFSSFSEDGRFEAVARMLHGSTEQSDAETALSKLGKEEEMLPEKLSGRDKKDFYHQGDGKADMKKVVDLLDDLKQRVDNLVKENAQLRPEQLWRVGLQMLAERIAERTRKAQERR